MKYVFAARCVLTVSAALVHATTLADETDALYSLSVRPSICIIHENTGSCSMNLELQWSSAKAGNVCLALSTSESVIHCWTQSREGQLALGFSSSENVILQLRSEDSGEILQETEINVVSTDIRDTRRRRRHIWSIL